MVKTTKDGFTEFGRIDKEVVGIRKFRLDALGRLTAMTATYIWTPGKNLAVCQRNQGGMKRMASLFGASYFNNNVAIDIDFDELMTRREVPITFGSGREMKTTRIIKEHTQKETEKVEGIFVI